MFVENNLYEIKYRYIFLLIITMIRFHAIKRLSISAINHLECGSSQLITPQMLYACGKC